MIPVFLDASACDAAPPVEVVAVLRVELSDRLVDAPRSDAYRAAMDCAGDVVVVSVAAPGAAGKSFRTNLAGVPANVRSRVVALGIAELVRDLDHEPRAPPRPPAPEEPMPPVERPPAPAPAPARRAVDLGAFATTSTFQLDGVWLAGGGLRFDYAFGHACVGLDAALLTTTERFDPAGTARAVLAYGSPYAAWHERWGAAQTRLGVGYALGAARLSGQASDARVIAGTTTGPWTAPYGFAALGLTITDGLDVDARGRLGWVTSPVVGEVAGGSEMALRGLWASVEVGMAIAL